MQAEAAINKGDVAEATLDARENAMRERAIALGDQLTESEKKMKATIRNLVTGTGKPSKKQIGQAFLRMMELLEAVNRSDTVIRNFLYNHSLRANLKVRALRVVLDKRLGSPITDQELNKAVDELVKEDQEKLKQAQEEKQEESFAESLKEAQKDAAVRGETTQVVMADDDSTTPSDESEA